MLRTDKFLAGIVAGVIILVVVAFTVAYLRPKPAYGSEDTADGVAYNYLFALQQKDYERAYGYLSPTIQGHPDTLEMFIHDVESNRWYFGDMGGSVGLTIGSVEPRSDGVVIVSIQERRFYARGLFNSGENINRFDMRLRQEAAGWKIQSSESYWLDCWNTLEGCE